MSDFEIRLIPTDQDWQPTLEAAASAVAYVARLFSGSGDAVEEVRYQFYDRVTVIDAGECTTQIRCSRCGGDISAGWFLEHGVNFDHLDVVVPCCGEVVWLDTLSYEDPVGFARFEVSAMNANRPKYELDAGELADVAALLGHPVTQILAHY